MNYIEIVDTALSYADRQDTETVGKIDAFLRIVEARINRFLSTQKMIITVPLPLVLDQTEYQLPNDFQSLHNCYFQSVTNISIRNPLQLVTPEEYNVYLNTDTAINHYNILGANIRIDYKPTATDVTDWTLALEYFNRVVPLSTAVDTNWISEINPDCYIFGLVTEINAFVKDAQSTQFWNERFTSSLNEIKLQDNNYLWNDGPIFTRID
jgi:hypothetical protein